MKRFNLLIILLISVIVLVGCTSVTIVNTNKERTIKANFENLSNEYELKGSNKKNRKIDLYYEANDLNPYVDIISYINLLDGIYLTEYINYTKNDEQLELFIEFDDDSKISIYFDYERDEIIVDDMDFFYYYFEQSKIDYNNGFEKVIEESVFTNNEQVIFEIGKYNMDIKYQDKKTLVPFHLVNLLFNQATYFNTYYKAGNLSNNYYIYGIDAASISPSNSDDVKNIYTKLLESSYNDLITEKSVSLFTYDFMAFSLDYFYGLKEHKGISSAYDYLSPYKQEYMSNTAIGVYNTTIRLDDLHTSFNSRGYYNNLSQYIRGFSNKELNDVLKDNLTNINSFYSSIDTVGKDLNNHFNKKGILNDEGLTTGYTEIIDNSNTAIIYLYDFNVFEDTSNSTSTIIDKALASLVDTNIENVVLDISYNTGGNLGSLISIMTMISNSNVKYHSKNVLTNSTTTNSYKGTNNKYTDFTYYIKTSAVTFSAANLMASMAKELGIKVIGQNSSGGASSIMFVLLPDGSIINMSSTNVLSRLSIDNEYIDIENGIEVDFKMNNLRDEEELLNIINS